MADTVAQLVVELAAKDAGVAAKLRELDAELKKTAGDAAKTQTSLASLKGDGGAGMLRLAQARARLEVASGNAAGAERILQSSLAQMDRTTVQTIGAQTQLVTVQRRLSGETKNLAGTLRGLGGEIGGAIQGFTGLSLGVGGVVAALGIAGSAMLDASARASEISTALKGLSPDEVNAVSTAAVTLQQQFGSDLQGQIDATRVVMQTFATDAAGATDIIAAGFANGLNASDDLLDTLTEYSGYFADLGFSADESLSLIQRAMDAGARNTDYAGDAVKEFGIRLREIGTITALEPLSASLAQVVKDFQAGRISGEEAFTSITAGLAKIDDVATRRAAGVAIFGTKFEDLGDQAVLAMGRVDEALIRSAGAADQLNTKFTSLGQVGPAAFAAIGQALLPVNDALLEMINRSTEAGGVNAQAFGPAIQASYEGLSGAAREFADAQLAAGANLGQAVAAATQFQQTLDAVSVATGQVVERWDGGAGSAEELSAHMIALAGSSEANRLAVESLANGYTNGDLSAQQLAASLAAMETAQQAAAQAQAQAAAAGDGQAAAQINAAASLDTGTLAAQAQTQALADATDAAFAQANAGADLEAQARAAADALLASGNAGAAAATLLGNSTNPIDRLAASYYNLAAAQQAAGQGGGLLGKGFGAKSAKDETAVVRAQINARANLRGGVATKPTRGGGGGGGGGGGAAKADPAVKAEQKAEEQRAKEKERALEQLVSLEQSYGEQQAKIREDFAARMAEASQDFGDQQIDDRRSFYRSLLDIEDQGLRQQASAQYEAAAQKAAELRDTKGADVAAAYEAEAAKVIAAQAKRQEEIRKLQEDGKADEAQYLADLDKMDREAEQRKLDRIASGAGSLQEQQAQALTDAASGYAEKQADILGNSEAMNAAELAKLETLVAQTEQLRQQAALAGGPSAAAAAGAQAAGAAAGGAPTPPTATGGALAVSDSAAAAGLGAIVAQLQALAERLSSATTDSAGRVVGAVNGLRGSGTYLP